LPDRTEVSTSNGARGIRCHQAVAGRSSVLSFCLKRQCSGRPRSDCPRLVGRPPQRGGLLDGFRVAHISAGFWLAVEKKDLPLQQLHLVGEHGNPMTSIGLWWCANRRAAGGFRSIYPCRRHRAVATPRDKSACGFHGRNSTQGVFEILIPSIATSVSLWSDVLLSLHL